MTTPDVSGGPIIDPSADCLSKTVGSGTTIAAYCVILPRAVIGLSCAFSPHCFVENDVVVGDRVKVGHAVYLWDALRIGDDVRIDANVTFTTDRYPRSKQFPDRYPTTSIGRGAIIGGGACLLPGISIGAGAIVEPGSVVLRDVPPGARVSGSPAA